MAKRRDITTRAQQPPSLPFSVFDLRERARELEASGYERIYVGTSGVDGIDDLITSESPPFQNSVTQAGGDNERVSFIRLPGETLILGIPAGPVAAGTIMFTLPTVDRPAKIAGPFPIMIGDGTIGSFHVQVNGDVVYDGAFTGLSSIASTPLGTLGDASHVAQVTVDNYGRVTNVVSIAIQIAQSAVTGLVAALAGKLGIGDAAGGDLTGSYPNPTLVSTGPGATGPIGDGTHVAAITIDAKGRVTALGSVTITGAPPSGSAGGDLTGSFPNPALVNTGPGATGPIGDATHVPVITIDAKGRVTALSSAVISGGSGGGDNVFLSLHVR